MKLSISNIAWSAEYDAEMYSFLAEQGLMGLEIAPTRLFPQNPYNCITEAIEYAKMIKDIYGLMISSMQSIWYGRHENIFGSENDRRALANYTKKAVLFAEAILCPNLVFGCPRNRNIPNPEYLSVAVDFFREIGEFALTHGTVISIEPNPPYYNTNFINSTYEAFKFCSLVNCSGIKVNVDMGTMLNYGESIDFINDNIMLVNHIHISEPLLAVIEKRDMHRQLEKLDYNRWFSIEMKNTGNINIVKDVVRYIRGVIT